MTDNQKYFLAILGMILISQLATTYVGYLSQSKNSLIIEKPNGTKCVEISSVVPQDEPNMIVKKYLCQEN